MEWISKFAEMHPEIAGLIVLGIASIIGDAISHFIKTGPEWLKKYESRWVKLKNAIGNLLKKKFPSA